MLLFRMLLFSKEMNSLEMSLTKHNILSDIFKQNSSDIK